MVATTGNVFKLSQTENQLATPESSGRVRTSVQLFDFWDRLGHWCELLLVLGFQGNC